MVATVSHENITVTVHRDAPGTVKLRARARATRHGLADIVRHIIGRHVKAVRSIRYSEGSTIDSTTWLVACKIAFNYRHER